MKKNYFIFFLFLFILNLNVCGQNKTKKYNKFINKAEISLCEGKWSLAATYYDKAFRLKTPFGIDLRNAFKVNFEHIGDYEKSMHYAHLLFQRGYSKLSEEYENISIPIEKIWLENLSILEDTTTVLIDSSTRNKVLQILQFDQQFDHTTENKTLKDKQYSTTIRMLQELFSQYYISELTCGSDIWYLLNAPLVHLVQNKNDTMQDFLKNYVLKGEFPARKYVEYQDILFINVAHEETPVLTYSPQYYRIQDVLFIENSKDIRKSNKLRRMLNLSETHEDVVYKLKSQYLNKMFFFFTAITYHFGDKEDDEEEILRLKHEIDNEHQNNILYRTYFLIPQN